MCIWLGFSCDARTFVRPKHLIYSSPNQKEPDSPCLADEIAEPRPDMNIKVAAFTVSKKSIKSLKTKYITHMYTYPRLWLRVIN